MDERIAEVGPAIAVRVLASPTVASRGRSDGRTGDRRANIGGRASWIVPSSITVGVVPLRRVLWPCIAGAARACEPCGCWVRPTVRVRIGATPAIERGRPSGRSTAVRSIGRAPCLSVVVFLVITEAVPVGVEPLRGVVWEGVCKPVRMRNPQIGWVGVTVSVHVPTAESVEATDPA